MTESTLQARCPMGCGSTIFVAAEGFLTCGLDRCPNPTALSDIVTDGEAHHIVLIGETAFSVQHPLRERIDGELFSCSLHAWLIDLGGPPKAVGRYRVYSDFESPDWARSAWEKLPDDVH